MAYFPMYVDITNQPCLIVGGGMIAYRKAVVLTDFCAEVTVVAEAFCEELLRYEGETQNDVRLLRRSYEPADCDGKCLVVAATNDVKLNHDISVYCRAHGIPVNAVDQKEDCTFIFPSYIRQKDLVASFSSAGKSPLLAQVLKEQEATLLTPLYGELNECLGQLREYVKTHYKTQDERKRIYQSIYQWSIKAGAVPDEAQIQELLKHL